MEIPQKFRYNPKNHCWPAIRKSVFAIVSFTIALSLVEAIVLGVILDVLDLSWKASQCFVGAASLFNSLVLRRYIIILKKRSAKEYGEPRTCCHAFIFLFSAVFINLGIDVVHIARADMYHSQTLEGLTFNEAEYFYFDSPLAIDTARYGQDIKADSYSASHGTAIEHSFRGYYVAPFCGHDSVFYAKEFAYSRSVSRLPGFYKKTQTDIWKEFYRQFNVMCDNMSPITSNHLFHRIHPDENDYYWSALGYSFAKDSICHPIDEIHRSVILTPVENDRMPRWTDQLRGLFFLLPLYILMLVLCFGSSRTVPYSQRKNKRPASPTSSRK